LDEGTEQISFKQYRFWPIRPSAAT
jgi:hypothetical protein